MNMRKLGTADVSAIGFGCMNLSHAYGVPPQPEQAHAVLHRAVELGCTHFDTEEFTAAFMEPE
jgi:aryl-alcohol dehydrogenase-like predicted oxidoreductase